MRRYDSLADALKQTAARAQRDGRPVSPRGMLTHELPHHSLIINPHDTLCAGIGRGMNVPFAAVETLELIGGIAATSLKLEINPSVRQFVNDNDFAAYGPRVAQSLPAVIEALRHDPDTRQAVLTIFNSNQDLFVAPGTDLPCTVFLQFLLRDGFLELHTFMRSNDIWLGLTYDAFVFTQLQHTVAKLLNVAVGDYFHTATSMHLYERDFDKWKTLTPETRVRDVPIGVTASTTERVMWMARSLLSQSTAADTDDPSNAWYWNALWQHA